MNQTTRRERTLNQRKLFKRILRGARNVRFADLVALVEAFGFRLSRVSGSHPIFVTPTSLNS